MTKAFNIDKLCYLESKRKRIIFNLCVQISPTFDISGLPDVRKMKRKIGSRTDQLILKI